MANPKVLSLPAYGLSPSELYPGYGRYGQEAGVSPDARGNMLSPSTPTPFWVWLLVGGAGAVVLLKMFEGPVAKNLSDLEPEDALD